MNNTALSLNNTPSTQHLLLHSCCAPCLLGCIERVVSFFDVTLFFYNPNIDTRDEYDLRLMQLYKVQKEFDVKVVAIDYEHSQFLSAARGLMDEKEGGARCKACFDLRLRATAEYALNNGFDAFATTLTLSPHKNAALINEIGLSIAADFKDGVRYIPSDFKKQNGVLISKAWCEKLSIYRQAYCGCKKGFTN